MPRPLHPHGKLMSSLFIRTISNAPLKGHMLLILGQHITHQIINKIVNNVTPQFWDVTKR